MENRTYRWVIWMVWVGWLFMNIIIWYDRGSSSFSAFITGYTLGWVMVLLIDNLLIDSCEGLINSQRRLISMMGRNQKILMGRIEYGKAETKNETKNKN